MAASHRAHTSPQASSQLWKLIAAGVTTALIVLAVFAARSYQAQLLVTQATEQSAQIARSEEQYIVEMIAHHQVSVAATQYVAARTKDVTVKSVANDVMNKQTQQMWTLVSFYQTWYGKAPPMTSQYHSTMTDLSLYSGDDLDRMFLNGMAALDQEAIDLSNAVRQKTSRTELKRFVTDTVTDLTAERGLLQKMYSKYTQSADQPAEK